MKKTFSWILIALLTSASVAFAVPNGSNDVKNSKSTTGTDIPPVTEEEGTFGDDIKNVSGHITCSGEGVKGVVVSDGFEFTTTDENGYYEMLSQKKNGYIFYCIPSGYMPYWSILSGTNEEKIFPRFWMPFSYPKDVTKKETCNFKLSKESNDDHIMVFAADPQVANRSDDKDLQQYTSKYFPRMKQEYKDAGSTRIYTTICGDLAWDNYWYSNNYAHANYIGTLVGNSFLFKHFSVMGNHDHDGATPQSAETDFLASGPFRSYLGPNYYSYNIGKIHYIVLDDIEYLNEYTPGASYSKGIVGDRNYNHKVVSYQLDWLKKDLSYVSYDTPIFISVHAPFWGINCSSGQWQPVVYSGNNSNELCDLLTKFKTVHICSGHRHNTFNVEHPNGFNNVFEHNLGAVGGNLWWCGYYSGYPNCNDGTPGGWQVFHINGTDISWEFHTLNDTGNAQFRVIDVNTAKAFYNTDETYAKIRAKYSRHNWNNQPDNALLINVFNYDPAWKVEAWEGGKALSVKRQVAEDMFHTLTYDIPRFKAKNTYTEDNCTKCYSHMFLVQSSTATGTIDIKVTDRFGNEYYKTVERPIACTVEALAEGGETHVPAGIKNIKMMRTASEADIFVQSGTLCIESSQATQAQIAGINGSSRTVKLQAGHNEFELPQRGIYIVKVGNVTKKFFVK